LKTERTNVQKRIFVAFSDFAIMVALKNQVMTGYAINKYFIRKTGDIASTSTVYSTLATIERKGLIKCVRNRSGRAYALTDEGEKIVNSISNVIEESKRFMDKLLS
jgi:DNA-binding PadR family transcriptional regulator